MPQVLDSWSHEVAADGQAIVLPDGCRDLILLERDGAAPQWFVSPLMAATEQVACHAGDRFSGFRFHPGAVFDESRLLNAVSGCPSDQVPALVAELVRVNPRMAEALDALARSSGIAQARRALGVSERSLERLVQAGTGCPPSFWRGLARARQAAAALAGAEPLAAIAADCGYADQAHMTRAFRQWFGTSPGRFRASPQLLELVAQPGYG